MILSYIFYISLLVINCILAAIAQKKNNKKLLFVVVILMSLVVGLRNYSVGIDTKSYATEFNIISINGTVYWEHSFTVLCSLLQKISKNPTFIFFVCALITYSFIIFRLWDFRKISSLSVMISCFYILFFFRTLSAVRQCCAIAICFYFSRYIWKKRYFTFILGVIIASFFHKSAYLCFLYLGTELLLWKFISKKQKMIMSLAIISVPFMFRYATTIFQHYEFYFASSNVDIGYLVLGKLLFLIVTYFLTIKNDNKLIESKKLIMAESSYQKKSVFIYYLMGLVLTIPGYYFTYMERIGLYFYIFEAVYIGILLNGKFTKTKFIYFVGVLILLGYPFVSALVTDGYGVLPYKFFWQ